MASRILPGWLLSWATPLASSRRGSAKCPGINGSRPGFRSDGARFTVESFARYFVHDLAHHLHDVTGVPGTAGSAPAV